MADNRSELRVPEDIGKLIIMEHSSQGIDLDLVLASLRRDLVVLVRSVSADQADGVMHAVADRLGLSNALKLQAGFASFLGHRYNIGKYFMSVNNRDDYHFITPHSEGGSSIGMQLASFFCYENSTDGGETILMNVDDSSEVWQSLRESVKKGRLTSGRLPAHEIARARALYRVNLPADTLKEDDQILEERRTEIAGLTVAEVLAKPIKTYSCILDRKLYAYWDTVGSIDFDSAQEYAHLLRRCGLLREPAAGLDVSQMDNAADRRVWHSGVSYALLFKCKITRKLAPGELVIQNNMTWTHAVTNWSPGSGTRKIAACFA